MKKQIRTVLAASALLLASLACTFSLPEALATKPTGKIIFETDAYGNFELVSMDVNTRTTTRLTNNTANDVAPVYIPALNQIGFASDFYDRMNIFVMDASGGKASRVITGTIAYANYPDWSPDGKQIVASLVKFCPSDAESCPYDIYAMNADGTGLTNLTSTDASEWFPSWSPDGQKIVFESDRDGDSEIYTMSADGSGVVQLTDNNNYDGSPRWSPDGTRIVFDTDRDGGDWDIYVMNADGSDQNPVTTNSSNDFSPAWSPDGKWLVYVSDVDGDNEIVIVDVNGQNQERLTNNVYEESEPTWMP
jgi:Tol biopolymer transport system component